MTTPNDPAALFRQMLGQWEQMTNEFGAKMLGTGEFSRAMHGATAAGTKIQEVTHDAMRRSLAAANMPSREDVAELGTRIQALDDRLDRIEAMLVKLAGPLETPARPKPKRTKTPPAPT